MTTLREHHQLVCREIKSALSRFGEEPNEHAGDPRDYLIHAIDHLTNLPELEDWPVKATEPNPQRESLRRLMIEAEEVRQDEDIWKLRINPNVTRVQERFSNFLMHTHDACTEALSDHDPAGRLVER